jgi:hypothetical protein
MNAPPEAHVTPNPDTVVARAAVAWAVAGTEVVVRVPATGATHVLDPTAALLWQCLDGDSPLQQIFADLAAAFGVAPDVVAADCRPAVASWLQAGIVVASRPPAATPAPAAPHVRGWRRLVDPPNS